MALFTTLNVKEILQNPMFGPDYALMIFSIVALAIFLAGILSLPGKISPDRRGIVIAGFALVGLLAIGSAAPFVIDSLINPTLKMYGAIQPDPAAFTDDDKATPITLKAELDNQGPQPFPLNAKVGQIWVDTSKPLTVTVVNLPQLFDKYHARLDELRNERDGAAQLKQRIDTLCDKIKPQEKIVCLFLQDGAAY